MKEGAVDPINGWHFNAPGYLTHGGRGHLNCLNSRSQGLNNLKQFYNVFF